MLLIYGNAATWDAMSALGQDEVMRAHGAVIKELTASGELVANQALTTADARVVRVSGGVPAITDGPFTEAKEVLAGYYLVDCATLERAVAIAGRLPEAPFSPIEVRRVMDEAELWE
jgi:hypothetical protein